MLHAGEKAPLFALSDQNGKTVALEDFLGKRVVVYFYPKDNTPGCTRQACAFAAALDRYQALGVPVIGISRDSVASHARFAEKHKLPFILLSDPELQAIQAYDVWQEKKLYGKVSVGVVRTTYLIGPDGTIEKMWEKAKPDTNAAEILEYLTNVVNKQGEGKHVEYLDLYDRDRMKTGKTHRRGDPVPAGHYRLAVHVCIFNAHGQMLIQQRQPFKAGWPDKWDVTVGGSAVAGEDPRQAAERETLEEIGLALDLSDTRPKLTINFGEGFNDIYLVEREVDLETLRLQESEVQAVRWASREEILAMIDGGAFIPYAKSFIGLLFDTRKLDGTIPDV